MLIFWSFNDIFTGLVRWFNDLNQGRLNGGKGFNLNEGIFREIEFQVDLEYLYFDSGFSWLNDLELRTFLNDLSLESFYVLSF